MATSPIIDCDVHHTWGSDAVLLEYMAPEWRDYFVGSGVSAPARSYGRLHPPHLRYPGINGSAMRPEATPPVGGFPGSHYETLRDQHLNPHKISRALLTWNYGLHPGVYNAAASVALCRAANDFTVDYWLGQEDDRLRGTICVPVAVPEEAAKEVHRIASHTRMVAVIVAANPFHKPLGHPVYHQIYAAAAEYGLPIIAHLGSESFTNGSYAAGGLPTTKAEYYTLGEQPAMHHLSSLLVEGVFEKFPNLRFLFNEYGFLWMPWVLWGLDSRYEILRRESPYLRRRPIEYFREHVWSSTQPLAGEADPERVLELLEAFGGMEEKLCYASDYPHWDTEWPQHVTPRLPRAWRPKVMGENAARLFGWSLDELPPAHQAPEQEPLRA
jgi:predicted TIM-barrel fold metal-dependent hydrolase